MWGMERNGRGVIVAAGMLVAAAVLVGASPDATAQQATPVVVGAGQLRLHLIGTGGTVTWEVNGAVVKTQAISSSRCQVSTSGAQLLTFTPSTGDVGLVSNGFGVRTKNNCNTAEGRVGFGEALTVALGSAIPLDVRVTAAGFDIEGKFDASLDYSFGGDPTDYAPIPLSNASDNGPDAGTGDNGRVTSCAGPATTACITPTPFRSITLRPAVGELSLEGGGDYAATPGPADTILTLSTVFDQGVDCGESVMVFAADEAATEATFEREPNADPPTPPPPPCQEIPVTLDIRPDGVRLAKSTIGVGGTPQAVHSTLEIVWAPRPALPSFPARQVDFDGDPNGGPSGFEDVRWCAGTDPLTGRPIHPLHFPGTPSQELLPWCLVSETFEMQADGRVVQTQVHDGYGDPFYK